MKIIQIYEMYEKSSKWNLVEVRKRICMNVKRIRKEHYDEYKNISSDNLYKLADVFEISIDEFYK